MGAVKVRELLEPELGLELVLLYDDANLDFELPKKQISRPGLALTGYYDHFANNRIQIFGNGEYAYLDSLEGAALEKCLQDFFDRELGCLFFTHSHTPPAAFIDRARAQGIPVLGTNLTTVAFIEAMNKLLDNRLTPRTTAHGVLVEVYGVGIMLVGKSGVGKSETALELIERGHRLVADDIVEITCEGGDRLYGHSSEAIEHHMEIRGLGIINIKDLFGAGSVRKSKRIDLVIQLEDWDPQNEYDRVGLEEQASEILGVAVNSLTVPVRPGRNVRILVETAAKNHRLKQMGVHAARAFNERLLNMMQEKSKKESGDDK